MKEMLMQEDLSFLSRWVPPEERPSKERLKELIRAYIRYSSQFTSEEEKMELAIKYAEEWATHLVDMTKEDADRILSE